MQVVVKFSKYIFQLLAYQQHPANQWDCCDPICQLMFYVCWSLFWCLSSIFSPSSCGKAFAVSTIWRSWTKEEQLYFSIGVQESEFSVCLMLLNILRLKESAWISQCVSRLLSTLTLSWHLLLSFGTRMFLLQKTKLDHDEVWHDNTLVTVESLPCKGPYTPGRISARVIRQRFSRVFCVHTQAIFADDEPSEHANSFPDIRWRLKTEIPRYTRWRCATLRFWHSLVTQKKRASIYALVKIIQRNMDISSTSSSNAVMFVIKFFVFRHQRDQQLYIHLALHLLCLLISSRQCRRYLAYIFFVVTYVCSARLFCVWAPPSCVLL